MNFNDNFQRVGSANVELIKAKITELELGRWESATNRRHYEAHRAAQSIPLVHDSDYRHKEGTRRPAERSRIRIVGTLAMYQGSADKDPYKPQLRRFDPRVW